MKIIKLPDELTLDSQNSINVFDYKSLQEISMQQIILNKNTFSFLLDGQKEVFFDNSSFAIRNTKFLLMKSGHCLMTEKLSDIKSNYRSMLFFFSDEMVIKFIRKYELKKSENLKYQSVFSFDYDLFINRFVISLLDVIKLSKQGQENILNAKFEEILHYLIEFKGSDFLFALVTNSDDESHKFTETIESNQFNKLTLDELAFLCNMSVSTFKREFKKHYKESPMKWFKNKRLELASRLLKDEQKRSSDIYIEAGFDNLSSFVQAYKTKFGVTPKQHYSN
ncbi:MAG: AraC-like DNA-binding protein [Halioglobus sp.]|jgi:AraC-like DNA-binding protein